MLMSVFLRAPHAVDDRPSTRSEDGGLVPSLPRRGQRLVQPDSVIRRLLMPNSQGNQTTFELINYSSLSLTPDNGETCEVAIITFSLPTHDLGDGYVGIPWGRWSVFNGS